MKNRPKEAEKCGVLSWGEELPRGAAAFSLADLWSKDDKTPLAPRTCNLLCLASICQLVAWERFLESVNLHRHGAKQEFCCSPGKIFRLWPRRCLSAHPFLSSSPVKEITSSPPFLHLQTAALSSLFHYLHLYLCKPEAFLFLSFCQSPSSQQLSLFLSSSSLLP